MNSPDTGDIYAEVRERCLKLLTCAFTEVYDDVMVRSFRTSDIEITEVKSNAEGHSLLVYVRDKGGKVASRAYSWEQFPNGKKPYIKSRLGNLQTALDIMRNMMVLDDLANT